MIPSTKLSHQSDEQGRWVYGSQILLLWQPRDGSRMSWTLTKASELVSSMLRTLRRMQQLSPRSTSFRPKRSPSCRNGHTTWCTPESDTAYTPINALEASRLPESLSGLNSRFDRVQRKEHEVDRDSRNRARLRLVSSSVSCAPPRMSDAEGSVLTSNAL